MKKNKRYIAWGITAFLVILGGLIAYYIIFHLDNFKSGIKEVIVILMPIIDGIILSVSDSTFVVETGAVKEFVRVTDSMMVYEPEGDEYIMLRGTCLPVVRLNRKFHLEGGKEQVEEGIMAVLEHEEKQVCVFVDELVGEQEIVVKPIPSYIKKVSGISGCTQLGDGSIALILDTGGLV